MIAHTLLQVNNSLWSMPTVFSESETHTHTKSVCFCSFCSIHKRVSCYCCCYWLFRTSWSLERELKNNKRGCREAEHTQHTLIHFVSELIALFSCTNILCSFSLFLIRIHKCSSSRLHHEQNERKMLCRKKMPRERMSQWTTKKAM